MGAPRRNRRKFEKPKRRWNLERIKNDNELIEQYGLKSMKELWKAQTEISRIRSNARELLSGSSKYTEDVKGKILGRLARLGVVKGDSTLDALLDLKENALLERRLQTVVFRKGLARSINQARQLTVHGFISINGKRVNRPGYMVDSQLEKFIGYYKPISITPKKAESTETVTEGPAEAAEAVKTVQAAEPEKKAS
jgi:small subunit ribosomal protein S4